MSQQKRQDISKVLFHWCKFNDEQAFETLLNILKSGSINGSADGIKDKSEVICFSETPYIEVLEGKFGRYKPFGIAISKSVIFSMGGTSSYLSERC